MSDLFSPFVKLVVGGNEVRNLFDQLDIWLSRKEPADVAEFTLKPGIPDLGLVRDTAVEIWMGYDEKNAWRVFTGYVVEPMPPRYLCKDGAVRLFKTRIVQTFLNATPQDIIRFGLRKAGVQEGVLAPGPFPAKPRFVAAGENVSDLVKRVNATWGLDYDHYFDGDGRFYWDPPAPKPGPVYSYRFGENIIDLEFYADREPSGQRSIGSTVGSGKLLTVASPFVGHSREIEIIWPEVAGSRYLVETVHHFMNDKKSLRTEIFFRELEAG
ncbi:hypothetical protein G7K71_08660 [Desulfofundulus sp. TPOSR]|uniref:hypothetical protein n=1 Tax=Desulfofundulus sp. TPOSR TaxID=2714340 RepID=UPI00140ACEFB|nr:hypothetical protein [Desulfofundulus sp. TPOSR]NHM25467.1 hypothetical protein [Desulfofundulus sp. TPOSR]NHM27055.1 hypothetical protein [Desulfofundulus sp. TPOSR]